MVSFLHLPSIATFHILLRSAPPNDTRGVKASMTTSVVEPSLWFPISTNFFLPFVSALCNGVNGARDWIHADLSERPAHRK